MRLLPLLTLCLAVACGSPEATTPPPPSETLAAANPPPAEGVAEARNPALLDPSPATETAPATYKVRFETTEGDFVVQVHRAWAPLGADRFYNLVKIGYFDDVAFFRAIDDFMVQFGVHGDPAVTEAWSSAPIQDDPVQQSNTRGMVTFATAGANTRTTQIFVNYVDRNRQLDAMGFAPFGEVVQGMSVVDSLYKGYGEGAPRGTGPHQGRLKTQGNPYLKRNFPELDYVVRASIVE